MQISCNQLSKFIRIYEKRFGIKLDKGQALEKAIDLLEIIKIVYKPIKKNELLKLKNYEYELFTDRNKN